MTPEKGVKDVITDIAIPINLAINYLKLDKSNFKPALEELHTALNTLNNLINYIDDNQIILSPLQSSEIFARAYSQYYNKSPIFIRKNKLAITNSHNLLLHQLFWHTFHLVKKQKIVKTNALRVGNKVIYTIHTTGDPLTPEIRGSIIKKHSNIHNISILLFTAKLIQAELKYSFNSKIQSNYIKISIPCYTQMKLI